MIKSMTGFASVALEDDSTSMTVTVRAVNHRFLDVQLRMPQTLAALESEARTLVAKHVARGRIHDVHAARLVHDHNAFAHAAEHRVHALLTDALLP